MPQQKNARTYIARVVLSSQHKEILDMICLKLEQSESETLRIAFLEYAKSISLITEKVHGRMWCSNVIFRRYSDGKIHKGIEMICLADKCQPPQSERARNIMRKDAGLSTDVMPRNVS
ncbi:hypothetical protein MUP77_11845 [Candidatus Bathyarchaeota archaeon]|nr:hypothetical protein [Candidatus Bathyarchaeota archaeon]